MDILQKTMNEMPNIFTSHAFNKRAIKNGYPKKLIQNKGLAHFIRLFATNEYYGSKTWVKIQQSQPTNNQSTSVHQSKDASTDVNEMIGFLKRKGYKIMKPSTEWEEC